MNNPAQKQRLVPVRIDKPRAATKKNALGVIAKRRQQDLLSHWKLLKSLGMPLKLARMAERLEVNPSLPSQYLNGSIALNIEWMMEFSVEMCCAPQDIFRDWPYPQMTRSQLPPDLVKLIRAWKSLSAKVRRDIHQRIDRDLGRR